MKKIVCGVLIAFIGFIFSACGSQDENTERVNDTVPGLQTIMFPYGWKDFTIVTMNIGRVQLY